MKTLLILRHDKSRSKDLNLSDHDRPLDELGKDDALNMGKLIKYKDLIPDFIISSTALRAKTTAEIVAQACKYKGEEIALERSLYEGKSKEYMNIIERLSDRYSSVLLVGHNPTIEEIIELFTDYSSDVIMSSCALAHLSLSIEKWSDLQNSKTKHQAVLKEIIQPK
jgi:phosphohistidine phosphatase